MNRHFFFVVVLDPVTWFEDEEHEDDQIHSPLAS